MDDLGYHEALLLPVHHPEAYQWHVVLPGSKQNTVINSLLKSPVVF